MCSTRHITDVLETVGHNVGPMHSVTVETPEVLHMAQPLRSTLEAAWTTDLLQPVYRELRVGIDSPAVAIEGSDFRVARKWFKPTQDEIIRRTFVFREENAALQGKALESFSVNVICVTYETQASPGTIPAPNGSREARGRIGNPVPKYRPLLTLILLRVRTLHFKSL